MSPARAPNNTCLVMLKNIRGMAKKAHHAASADQHHREACLAIAVSLCASGSAAHSQCVDGIARFGGKARLGSSSQGKAAEHQPQNARNVAHDTGY